MISKTAISKAAISGAAISGAAISGAAIVTGPGRAWRGLGLAAGLAVLLAACAGDDGPRLPCPGLYMVTDANKQVKFVGTGRDLTDVEFEAVISNPLLACRYDDDEAVESRLTFNLIASRGPADDDRQALVGYFVAISTVDRRVLAREEFDILFEFEGNRTRISAAEEIEQRIPLPAGASGADFDIYIGLTLTPDELSYNRENR